jgi:GT2 family glycosyltransferase
VHRISGKRWFVGRSHSLVAIPLQGIEPGVDGLWQACGPLPLVAFRMEQGGPIPTGDVRLEFQVSSDNDPVHATLVLDTGAGFEAGPEFPLPVSSMGHISTVTTLPEGTVALGLRPGPLRRFQLSGQWLFELSVIGALVAHGAPQLRRLLRDPARLVLLFGRAVRLLRNRGTRGVLERLRRGTQRQLAEEGYEGWARRYADGNEKEREQLRSRLTRLSARPTFSILLARGESSAPELRRTLEALARQIYPDWELCLAEGASSETLREVVRASIPATHVRWVMGADALEGAHGDFVMCLKPGDAFSAQALFAVAEAVSARPDVALLYTDSDSEDETGHVAPAFKPEWSPELLRSRNYIGRAAFFRTDAVRSLGGWRSGPGDAAQHALLLQYTGELARQHTSHLPLVLLHTVEQAPTAEESLSSVGVLQASLDRAGVMGRIEMARRPVTYRMRYALPNPAPLVTVIVPTKDQLSLLRRCIRSVLEKTGYQPLELLVVDNESRRQETLAYLEHLEGQGTARVLPYPHPFNFSAMNNFAVRQARGAVLCFLNNDVEAIDAGWLTEMVGLALQAGVGAVGAKLLYPNNTVQHAGTVAGLFGVAAHVYLREPREADGYLQQLQTTREVAAVTAACMVVRRDRFLEVGGFDETELAVAFNDVDFCFKLLKAGYRNLWTPYAELYHRESASRGTDERGEDRSRFLREEAVMRARWATLIEADPYYSPNLSLDSNVPRPAWPPRVRWPQDNRE